APATEGRGAPRIAKNGKRGRYRERSTESHQGRSAHARAADTEHRIAKADGTGIGRTFRSRANCVRHAPLGRLRHRGNCSGFEIQFERDEEHRLSRRTKIAADVAAVRRNEISSPRHGNGTMKHMTEEELIAYREGVAEQRVTISEHLAACEQCRGELERIEAVLAALDTLAVPDPGTDYGRQVWKEI